MRKVVVIEDGLCIVDIEKIVSSWRYILWIGRLDI